MRKSKVVGFSIPPKLEEKFNDALEGKSKTKSEFFREMLDVYFRSIEETKPSSNSDVNDSSLAGTLENYWNLRSSNHLKTIVIGLAIIVKNHKVLIGSRKNQDKWVKNLSWVFPGGEMNTLNFEKELVTMVKKETNLDIKVTKLLSTRIHPDSGVKPIQIVALYFVCEPTSLDSNPGGDLSELKWVNPTDVFRHFTTSTNDDVTNFLNKIEESK